VFVDTDHEQELQRVVEKIRFERKYKQPLILFGERKIQSNFVKAVEEDFYKSIKYLWVMHDVFKTTDIKRDGLMMSITRGNLKAKKITHKWRALFDVPIHLRRNNSRKDLFISNAQTILYYLKTDGILAKYHDRTLNLRKQLLSAIVSKYSRVSFFYTTIHEYKVSMSIYSPGNLREIIDEYTFSTYKGLKCFVPVCDAGTYLHFGEWYDTFWNSQQGWRCTNCPNKTFKSKPGNEQCTLCPPKTFVNKERTFCYDPYRNVHLNIYKFTVQLCVAFSCMVSMLVMSFLLVLIKYHDTPVAHAMDLKVSIFHLTLLLLHVLVSMVFFIGLPNPVRCITQPAFLSLLGTTSTSIVLVKSQKLLRVFKSKVKLEHRDVVLVTLKQSFVVLVNVIVSAAILLLSLQIYWFHIDVVDNDETLERSVSCDMSIHNGLQVGYQMLLQLVCFVPAFRSRGLPSIFNEAMTIVYLSFTLIVVNGVMFPIQYFQKDLDNKTIVQWVFLDLNILLVLMIYYGKKMFIMIFRKKKNTKEYFQKRTMSTIQKRVRKLTN